MIPEETLMKIGFKTLDLMYGELTTDEGLVYDELFDKGNKRRLAYNKIEREKGGSLGYFSEDRDFFLSIIPVEVVDYQRVLRAWFEERYKRKVGIAAPLILRYPSVFEERYKRKVGIAYRSGTRGGF